MSTSFDISPEKRASTLHFFYRQFFITPSQVTRHDADLTGKKAIITGSNVGLGLEAAHQLLDLGCKVILAVRNESKGEAARQELAKGRSRLSNDSIEVWKLDMSSYDSIIQFVDRVKNELDHLDIAILNAGVYHIQESFASTGYEEDFQVNYLSTMLLTILLLPVLKDKKTGPDPARLVVVTSDTAAWAKFEERTSNPLLSTFRKEMTHWDMAERYATSKLLGLLFLTELLRRGVSSSSVTVSYANPGFCRGSELGRQATGAKRLISLVLTYLLGRTCSVGARSYIHAATVLGEAAHGQYIEDAKVQP